MKRKFLAFLLSGLLLASAFAAEKNGLTITLTVEEAAACKAGGGCAVVPLNVLKGAVPERVVAQQMQEALETGLAQGESRASKQCGMRVATLASGSDSAP